MDKVTIDTQTFKLVYDNQVVNEQIEDVATTIRQDYKTKDPVFLIALNGGYWFGTRLLDQYDNSWSHQVDFIKLSSYTGTTRSQNTNIVFDPKVDLANRDLIVIEDIIDTGDTVKAIEQQLVSEYNAKSVTTACLTCRITATFCSDIKIDYCAFTLPDEAFVIGRGLDYNERGRELPGIYRLESQYTY